MDVCMIRDGYNARPEPLYFEDFDGSSGVLAQPGVYEHAGEVARAFDAQRLVDFGCGKAIKLVSYRDEFEIIGLDYGVNLEWCGTNHPGCTWLEHDFEVPGPVDVEAEGSVIICADVIEHLAQPQHLVDKLKNMLDRGAVAVLISTPEREATYGPYHDGPPPNPHHTREWSIREFSAYMRHGGFKYGTVGLTRNNTDQNLSNTLLCAYVADPDDLDLLERVMIDSGAR